MLGRLFKLLFGTASPATSRKVYVDGWEKLPRVPLAADWGLEVVGESYSIEEIRRVDTNPRNAGASWSRVAFKALIIPEPLNPYDKNAIVVCVPGIGAVGHIAREDHSELESVRAQLQAASAAGEVDAQLVGGWGQDGSKTIPPGVIVRVPSNRYSRAQASMQPQDIALPDDWLSRPRVRLESSKPKEINAVGEYAYQERLGAIVSAAMRAALPATFEAVLVPTPVDHEEVKLGLAVCAPDGPVARVSVTTARAYRNAIAALSESGHTATCSAYVFVEAGKMEVKLRMPSPAEAAAACPKA